MEALALGLLMFGAIGYAHHKSDDNLKPNKHGQLYSRDYTAIQDKVSVRVHELTTKESISQFKGINLSRRRWDSIVPLAIDIDNQSGDIYRWTEQSLALETLTPEQIYKKLGKHLVPGLLVGCCGAAGMAGVWCYTTAALAEAALLTGGEAVAISNLFTALSLAAIWGFIMVPASIAAFVGLTAPIRALANRKYSKEWQQEVAKSTPVIKPGEKKRIYTFVRRPDYKSTFSLTLSTETEKTIHFSVALA